jgi:hypothetical protein
MLRPSTTIFDDASARRRILLTCGLRHRRLPNLLDPSRFTELVQHRKLHDRDPLQSLRMDKLAAKAMVAEQLGRDWTIPVLWQGRHLPDAPMVAGPIIVKARHGCNQYAVLRTPPSAHAWLRLQRRAQSWCDRPYGLWLDEWAYRAVPRGLLAESLMGGDALPLDYKIYVFGGRATHVQVHLDRGGRHRWVLHDRDWRQLVKAPDRPAPPASLGAMLEAAEILAKGMDFVRIDFYELAGKPVFGEFCLYPGSGLDPFAADWIDHELGALWLAAKSSTRAAESIEAVA